MGEETAFHGIADLLTDSALLYEGGAPRQAPTPDDLADVDEDEEIGRADDDGMGEAIGAAVPEDDDDEDGSK